jgi:phage/plasmid-associated DNA primase
MIVIFLKFIISAVGEHIGDLPRRQKNQVMPLKTDMWKKEAYQCWTTECEPYKHFAQFIC